MDLLSSGQLTTLGFVLAAGALVVMRLMAVKTTEGRCWRKGFHRLDVRMGKWSVEMNLPYPEVHSHPAWLFIVPIIVLCDITVAWSSVGFTSVLWEAWGGHLHPSYRLLAPAAVIIFLMMLLDYLGCKPTKDSRFAWILGGALLVCLFQRVPLMAICLIGFGLLLLWMSYDNTKAAQERAIKQKQQRTASLARRQRSVVF